jgi:nicotinamidase-related amidase
MYGKDIITLVVSGIIKGPDIDDRSLENSVIDGISLGYNMVVVSDCICGASKEIVDESLHRMEKYGATVIGLSGLRGNSKKYSLSV